MLQQRQTLRNVAKPMLSHYNEIFLRCSAETWDCQYRESATLTKRGKKRGLGYRRLKAEKERTKARKTLVWKDSQ